MNEWDDQIRRSKQKKSTMIDWYRQKIALTKMVDNKEVEEQVLVVDMRRGEINNFY